MRTLKRRLAVGLSLILILVFVAQWVALRDAIRAVAERQMVMHLEHDGEGLFASLDVHDGGALILKEIGVEDVYRQHLSGHYYVVFLDGRAKLASPSLGDRILPAMALPPAGREIREVDGPAGERVLTVSQGRRLMGHDVSITIGEELDSMNGEIERQSTAALSLILPLLFATVLVQSFTIWRALRPLAGVQSALKKIRHGELAHIDAEVPGEIQPLVDEVNRLLELMHRRLLQSRTAVGNLAHAIKTPLAVLFRIADDPALPAEQSDAVITQTATIRDRVERELRRARLVGSGRVGAHVNLHVELQEMVKILAKIYREKGLEISIDAPDQLLPYDREDLLELLGNLADNACKWAARRVSIEVRETRNGGIQLRVADDGPGCTPTKAQVIGQRGVRLDETIPGYGLGLAICQDIVDFYGGTMQIGTDAELGGFLVRVRLPKGA